MDSSVMNGAKSLGSGRGGVEELLSLISSAARNAMAEYEKAGHSVPSLDMSALHPLDTTYDMVELKKAIGTLEGACQQLCNTLAQPAHTVGNHMTMPVEPACLRVAAQAGVADILAEYPNGAHVDKVASMVGINSEKMARVLRLLCMRGFFREVSPNVFANNRLSLTLLSSDPISSSVKLFTDDFNKGLSVLYETLVDPEFSASFEPNKSPFMYSHRGEFSNGAMWDWYQQHPKEREHFGRGMVGWSNVTGAMAALQCPVWSSLPSGSSVCDIGSGVGGFTINLAKNFPELKVTLCDRPETISQAKQFWESNYPDAIRANRVEFIPGDFFQQAVEGHDIYYIRHVIHNWRDPQALIVLGNIRKVMRADTKLLIQEYVLPHSIENQNGENGCSANNMYHPGSGKLYNLDLMMLVALNAKERTLSEYTNLGEQAGLSLVRHWEFAETSLLEFRIADPVGAESKIAVNPQN